MDIYFVWSMFVYIQNCTMYLFQRHQNSSILEVSRSYEYYAHNMLIYKY